MHYGLGSTRKLSPGQSKGFVAWSCSRGRDFSHWTCSHGILGCGKTRLARRLIAKNSSSRTMQFCKISPKQSSLTWFAADDTPPSQRFAEMLNGYGNRMRSAGYSTVEITTYWEQTANLITGRTQALEPFERFVIQFSGIFDHAEAVTLRNRVAGTFNGANSLGLLRQLTQQAAEELQIVWQNHQTYGSFFSWSWSGGARTIWQIISC